MAKGYTASKWHHHDNYTCDYCSYSVMNDEDAMVTHVNKSHADKQTVRPAEVGGDQARDTGVTQTQTGKEHTTEPDDDEKHPNLSERMKEREEGGDDKPEIFR